MSFRLGRQNFGGGAARYVRFDGLTFASDLGEHFEAHLYGGLTVLPLWNQQPGYYLLGSAADSLLRDPEAIPPPSRTDHWLAGGRLGWHTDTAGAGVSVHEQQETGGLSRRNLGADGQVDISRRMQAAGKALFELDARRFVDARVWVDANITRSFDASVEYFHAEPALLLSRQSVLSVFSTAAYDEVGAFATFKAARALELEGSSWLQLYETGHPGARSEVAVKVHPTPDGKTLVRIAYARILAPDNGYHSVRASLVHEWVRRLSSSFEAYNYFYDEAILSARTSSVYTGTLAWNAMDPLDVMVAASLLRSPYAEADAQGQVRLAYSFERATRK
jgi:hypothetical protein